MLLPKQIKTKHKIRDFKICKLFIDDESLTYKDIGSRFGITASRIEQILSANCDLINSNKEWEKSKRKRLLKRWIKKLGDSSKDPADLLKQLKEEDDINSLVLDQSTHNHFTWKVEKTEGDNGNGNGKNRLYSGLLQA